MIKLMCCEICANWSICHGQCGSASPVLMATGLVSGKGQTLTPYRIDTPKLIGKKFVIVVKFHLPSSTCSTVVPAQHLRPSGFFSCWSHGLDRFYPGPNDQCRLFQTLLKTYLFA